MALKISGWMKTVEQRDAATLAELRPHSSAEVVGIASADDARLMKLAALGIVPGSTIHLQQRRPAYVVRVGETLLSLSKEVATDIHIRPIH